MKGSKRNCWLKDGMKTSKKWNKKIWNRKVRHSDVSDGGNYRKIAKDSMYDGVS